MSAHRRLLLPRIDLIIKFRTSFLNPIQRYDRCWMAMILQRAAMCMIFADGADFKSTDSVRSRSEQAFRIVEALYQKTGAIGSVVAKCQSAMQIS